MRCTEHTPHEQGHSHDHDRPGDHDHGHGRRGDDHVHPRGLRGVLGEIFRPHSHDAADSIDTALETTRRGVRAVVISFTALFATALAQLLVVVLTGSVALLADTIHNFSDALTAVPMFIAFRLSRRAANRRYTYGYRRAEDLAGLFVLAMITLSAVIAAWEAIDRLIHPRQVDHLGVLVAAGLIGFVGNEVVALYRIREGRAIGSAALVADGFHARTDGFTSIAVAIGAVGVWAGFDRADPIVGLIISVAIFAVLRAAAKQVYWRLMDAVDPAIVDEIEHQVGHASGVQAVTETKVRWLGHRLAAEVTIAVDPTASVAVADQIAAATRDRLSGRIAHLDELHIQVRPNATG
jgi:cation diffusion facilitator family transporter